MKILKNISCVALLSLMALAVLSSCSDSKSYSKLLQDENMAVNRFLVDHRVVTSVPADSVFEVGADAPYYQLDEDANIYMQVLSLGSGPKIEDDQLVYFRFLRYNLGYYSGDDTAMPSEGNMNDLSQSPTSFRYQNFSLPSSSAWGTGIQMPLNFLPDNWRDLEVNLIVKSQFGWTSEVSYVIPYLYKIRYYKSQI